MDGLKLVGTSNFTYNDEGQLQRFLENELKKAKKRNRVVVLSGISETTLNNQKVKQVSIEFYYTKEKE